MPDLRKDPIVGRWVIVAKSPRQTAARLRYVPGGVYEVGQVLPVLRGATKTKLPTKSSPTANPGSHRNREGWRVRVVPNKFPALEIEGDLNKRGDGIYDMMRGVGAHEVIIETPKHVVSTSELSEAQQLREVLWVYRDRLVDSEKGPTAGLWDDLQERRVPRPGPRSNIPTAN